MYIKPTYACFCYCIDQEMSQSIFDCTKLYWKLHLDLIAIWCESRCYIFNIWQTDDVFVCPCAHWNGCQWFLFLLWLLFVLYRKLMFQCFRTMQILSWIETERTQLTMQSHHPTFHAYMCFYVWKMSAFVFGKFELWQDIFHNWLDWLLHVWRILRMDVF